MRILLVENDALLKAALTKVLEANRYTLDQAASGSAALDLATAVEYDLILLDVETAANGVRLCQQLRAQGYSNPILLLTANQSDAEIVAGFDAGADDYIHKPCAPEVLLAQIRTLLRRAGALRPQTANQKDKTLTSTLAWGPLRLDFNAGRVMLGAQTISLTATEYNLLELFLRHPDRIFSRSAILDRLWSFDEAPTDRAVNTYMKDLRKKLKAGGLTEDCIETIYGMGYRLKPAPVAASGWASSDGKGSAASSSAASSSAASTSAANPSAGNSSDAAASNPRQLAIERVLAKYRDSFTAQAAVLEQANAAWLADRLDPDLQQAAEQEAHKLAGSLASFGYPVGSRLARSIEHLLIGFRAGSETLAGLADLVVALQQELAKPAQIGVLAPATPAAPVAPTSAHRVLVIDDDAALTASLQAESAAWGLQITVAASLAAARSDLLGADPTAPDVVLLDLGFPGAEASGLTLLQELADQLPQLPVIVFTGRDSLADRLAAARLGARQFLHKPARVKQIFQAILRLVPQPQTTEAKVLVVDDDPALLTLLSSLLVPWGLAVETLADPQQFWQVLTTSSPDLVLLDLEMPEVSGLDLCQVVRQDAQWGDLPILVVTAHRDAESLQQAFAAGADDFISKPVLGPELVTRVLSRIERQRAQQTASEIQPLRGKQR